MERREEVTPEFLRTLEDAVNRATQLEAEGDYMAHLYAMFPLAQFRETRAYPLVVRLASLPGDLLDSFCGDFITEDLGAVLASVCEGELPRPDNNLWPAQNGTAPPRSIALARMFARICAINASKGEN